MDDVAVDFFFEEVSETEEHLFTLIEFLFSFIFLDLGGDLYDEYTVNQQLPFQNWGGGAYTEGGGLICRNIRYVVEA